MLVILFLSASISSQVNRIVVWTIWGSGRGGSSSSSNISSGSSKSVSEPKVGSFSLFKRISVYPSLVLAVPLSSFAERAKERAKLRNATLSGFNDCRKVRPVSWLNLRGLRLSSLTHNCLSFRLNDCLVGKIVAATTTVALATTCSMSVRTVAR